jgi:hypothetical protein
MLLDMKRQVMKLKLNRERNPRAKLVFILLEAAAEGNLMSENIFPKFLET